MNKLATPASFKKGHTPLNKLVIGKECKTCGGIFATKPSHYERRQFCSRGCLVFTEARKFNISRALSKKVRLYCNRCNTEFMKPPSQSHQKFCSQKCSSEYLSIAYKGSGGSNWKGGITPLGKQQRRLFRQTILKSVLERDNYTCQLCGIRGGDLQVDHIQSWAEYVELRFSTDNCRTLCMSCHYQVTFGKPMPPTITNFGRNLRKYVDPLS